MLRARLHMVTEVRDKPQPINCNQLTTDRQNVCSLTNFTKLVYPIIVTLLCAMGKLAIIFLSIATMNVKFLIVNHFEKAGIHEMIIFANLFFYLVD